jgi:hypothetical protein
MSADEIAEALNSVDGWAHDPEWTNVQTGEVDCV